jgi:4-amino-4-deoxy-L-arabinose transferase-like glycosyltransferase
MDLKRLKFFITILASLSVVLGVSHHFLNFWGLEVWRETLIFFIAIPVLSFPILLFVNRVWDTRLKIEKKRQLLFFYPAMVVAALLTWYFYLAPSVWHQIEIIPAPGQSSKKIELYEIKIPRGRVLKFSKTDGFKGWVVQDNALKTTSANPGSVSYSFFSPVGETTSLLFLRSPGSRDVTVALDGKKMAVELHNPDTGLQSVSMTTSYKMGIPGGIVIFIVAAMDFSAFFFLIVFIWVIQEIAQFVPVGKVDQDDRFPSHRTNLIILLALAFGFHALNSLSVPLIVASDSPSYLQGSIHWLQYHNLEGVPAARGPGTTFLFVPAFLLFGKNPWGVKLALHLLAIAAVPALYRLGWQLFKRRSFAFFSGLIAVLMPEMYLYSNIVMSDVPNVFFVLACCTLLLSALEISSWKNLIAFALVCSFAVLLRPENVTLLAIGIAFLFIKIIWEKQDIYQRLQMLGVAVFLALIPLVYWSAHNNRVHGFFGLSNYADEVLYDGWIYFGEASGFQITDLGSPAVQSISEALNAYDKPLGSTLVPTGWEIYPALLQHGYTEHQAIKLLGDAAKDSIRKAPRLSTDLYFLKLKKAFVPEYIALMATTFPLAGEKTIQQPGNVYFDSEKALFPNLIPIQRRVYDGLPKFNTYVYRPLVLFCLVIALLAVYQKQFFLWLPVIAFSLSRMFVPITIGIASWHYMLAGIAILLMFTFLAIQNIRGFLSFLFNPKPE